MNYIKRNILPLVSIMFVLIVFINQMGLPRIIDNQILLDKNEVLQKSLDNYTSQLEAQHIDIKNVQLKNQALILEVQDAYENQNKVVTKSIQTYEASKNRVPAAGISDKQLASLLAEYESELSNRR